MTGKGMTVGDLTAHDIGKVVVATSGAGDLEATGRLTGIQHDEGFRTTLYFHQGSLEFSISASVEVLP